VRIRALGARRATRAHTETRSNPLVRHLLAGVVDAVPVVGQSLNAGPEVLVVALQPYVEDVGDPTDCQEVAGLPDGQPVIEHVEVPAHRQEIGDEVGVGDADGRRLRAGHLLLRCLSSSDSRVRTL
jgi:hypothetical protein